MKATSPLGRYSAIVSAVVIVGCIAAAIVARLLGQADPFLDGLALAAFGSVVAVSGSLTQLNGTVKRTQEQDELLTLLIRRVVALEDHPRAAGDGR